MSIVKEKLVIARVLEGETDAFRELVREGVITEFFWDEVTRAGISDEVRQPVVAYRYHGDK